VTRGQLPQRAGSLGLNGGGAAAAVPPRFLPNGSSRILVSANQTLFRNLAGVPCSRAGNKAGRRGERKF